MKNEKNLNYVTQNVTKNVTQNDGQKGLSRADECRRSLIGLIRRRDGSIIVQEINI